MVLLRLTEEETRRIKRLLIDFLVELSVDKPNDVIAYSSRYFQKLVAKRDAGLSLFFHPEFMSRDDQYAAEVGNRNSLREEASDFLHFLCQFEVVDGNSQPLDCKNSVQARKETNETTSNTCANETDDDKCMIEAVDDDNKPTTSSCNDSSTVQKEKINGNNSININDFISVVMVERGNEQLTIEDVIYPESHDQTSKNYETKQSEEKHSHNISNTDVCTKELEMKTVTSRKAKQNTSKLSKTRSGLDISKKSNTTKDNVGSHKGSQVNGSETTERLTARTIKLNPATKRRNVHENTSSCTREETITYSTRTTRLQNKKQSHSNPTSSQKSLRKRTCQFEIYKTRKSGGPQASETNENKLSKTKSLSKVVKKKRICSIRRVFDSNLPPNQCPECFKSYPTRRRMMRHRKMHDYKREKTYRCTVCHKVYSSPSSLWVHMKIHKKERKWACKICSKAFIMPCVLRRHMVVHTNERLFPCDICGKRFKTKDGISIHKLLHTGKKPHKCEQCGWAFALPGNLRQHIKTHINVKKFNCSYCNKRFLYKESLVKHELLH